MIKKQLTVLLVDDNQDDVFLIQEIIKSTAPNKYEVHVCGRLTEAFELLSSNNFDLILLDLILPDSPEVDSFNDPRFADIDIPIVVISSLNDEDLALRAVQAGAQDYLVKGGFDEKVLPRSMDYAIERHSLKKQLLELSIKDGLTGLYNRKGFSTLVDQQIKLAQRSQDELLFFFIDVDNLKMINAQFGHKAGDSALGFLADILRNTFRDSDIISRVGGDEFAVLTVDTKIADKDAIIQRLEIERRKILSAQAQPFKIWFSVGMSCWTKAEPKTFDKLMREADLDMYEQRRNKQEKTQPLNFGSSSLEIEGAERMDHVSQNGNNFLLIEDNLGDARLVQEYLKMVDTTFEITHVGRLAEAITHLESNSTSLILLDLSLPDSKGLETVEQIVDVAADIPLIVMTGLDDKDVALQALKLGAQDFLTKGNFDEKLLERSIQYAAERHQLHLQNTRYAIELQHSEARLSSIFNNVAIGMYRTTPGGEILFANQALVQMMGYPSFEELARRNLEDGEFIDQDYRRIFKQTLEEHGYVIGMESVWKKADGSEINVRESAKAIRAANGDILYYEGTSEDITAQVEAEKQLRLQSAALDAAANAIVITDRAGNVIWVNPAFEDLTGYAPDEVLGKNPKTWKSGAHDDEFYESFWQTILTGMVWQGEMINRRKDGRLYTENQTVAPLLDSQGEITHFIAIKEDISSRKQAEETLRRRMRELTVLKDVALVGVTETEEDLLIASVTDIIGENIYPDHFGVMLLDEARQVLQVHYSYRGLPEGYETPEFAVGEGVVGSVLKTGVARRIADASEVREYLPSTGELRSELCVPLMAGGKAIGVVNAESKHLDAFSRDDERLLTTVASQLSIAIEQIRHQNAEREQHVRAEALSDTALALNSSLDFDQILDQILDNVQRVIPCDTTSLMVNQNGRSSTIRHRGFEKFGTEEWISGLEFQISEESKFSMMMESGDPIMIPDITKSDLWVHYPENAWMRSYLSAPIQKDEHTFGFLCLYHHQTDYFSESHKIALKALTNQLSTAMENARLFDEIQSNLQDFSFLFNASKAYASVMLEPVDIAKAVARQFVDELGYYECSISLYGETKETLAAIVDYIKGNGQLGEFKNDWVGEEIVLKDFPATTRVMETLEPLIVQASDPNAEPSELAYMQSVGVATLVILPLAVRGNAIGIIELEEATEERHLTERELDLAQTLANQVAAELENANLYVETQKRAFELSRLYEASGSLLASDPTDLPTLSQTIVDTIRTDFGKSNCSLLLSDAQSNRLIRTAVSGPYTAKIISGQELFTDGPGIAANAFRARTILNVPDVKNWSSYVANWDEARSEIAIPLIVGEKVIGVIDIQSAKKNAFSKDDERIVSVFAERAALALENANLYQRQEEQLGFLEALHQIDLAITGSMDIHVTLEVVTKQVLAQLQVDAASILLLNPFTLILEPIANAGYQSAMLNHQNLRMGEGLGGAVAMQGTQLHKNCLKNEDCDDCVRKETFLREKFESYYGIPLSAKGRILGVLELFMRQPFDPDPSWQHLATTIATQAAIAIDNAAMFEDLEKSNLELSLAYDTTLEGWARALELRDRETEGHARRVVDLTLQLARAIGISGMDLVHIRRGALLHDVGKMGVPDRILQKPGSLDDDEWEIMRKHPVYSYEWLRPISYLRPALDIPHYHHERWDGSGYPDGLSGENIPLAARIFAIIDVWDALLSDRPYRKAWPREKTIEHIKEQSGLHFDPLVVETFVKLISNNQG